MFQHAVPAAPYSTHPPSPPAISIPSPAILDGQDSITVMPNYLSVDPDTLSVGDLKIITQNGQPQVARDSAMSWDYKDRRMAQPVLDFLYLGPCGIARDRQWLRRHNITMLIAARDSRMAQLQIMGVDRVASELGIEAVHIDVSGHAELIRAFPAAVSKINNHMLRVYREQALPNASSSVHAGQMVIDTARFRRGRVLVFCETGNDRSASIVVAYLMSVFGMNLVNAGQFLQHCRFCVSLDNDTKYLLKTYEEMLKAQRTVHVHQKTCQNATMALPGAHLPASGGGLKRGIEDVMDADDDDLDLGAHGGSRDQDRFVNRATFAPFMDAGDAALH